MLSAGIILFGVQEYIQEWLQLVGTRLQLPRDSGDSKRPQQGLRNIARENSCSHRQMQKGKRGAQ